MEIEKIVTTKYKVNGIMFDTYEQAELWKQKLEKESIVKMYDNKQEVTDADCAFFVYLKGAEAAQIFIEQAESKNSSYDGIEQGDEGFYYWDSLNEQYRNFDLGLLEDICKIFNTYIKDLL